MDLQSRFAIFTAVGIASFSAGLSLTTACSRVEAEPEKVTIHPALPTETKPVVPVSEKVGVKLAELAPAHAPAPVTKPSTETKALAADMVSVKRLVVTHGVKEHEPIAPAELVADTPILAFVELSNKDGVERNVIVTFEREGREPVGHVKLHVPADSPRFRTWAKTHNLREAGTWEAVVRGEDGKELGRQPFELLAMLDPA